MNDCLNFIPKVIETMDEPVGDPAMIPIYFLSQEASKYVKAVLAGNGADEFFSGFYYYKKTLPIALYFRKMLQTFKGSNKNFNKIDNLFNRLNETPSGFPLISDENERCRILGLQHAPEPEKWQRQIIEKLNRTKDQLKMQSICDIETWLPENIFMKYDKMTMANSLEGRSPFVNPRVFKIAMSLNCKYKIKGRQVKYILKNIGYEYLPKNIIDRPKQGLVLPMKKWLANGELKTELLSSIDSCNISEINSDL